MELLALKGGDFKGKQAESDEEDAGVRLGGRAEQHGFSFSRAIENTRRKLYWEAVTQKIRGKNVPMLRGPCSTQKKPTYNPTRCLLDSFCQTVFPWVRSEKRARRASLVKLTREISKDKREKGPRSIAVLDFSGGTCRKE